MANIEIKMKESAITLATQGTYCETDIEINAELQSKTVTENGTVTPDEGYLGLKSVAVNIPAHINTSTSAIAGIGIVGQAICGATQQQSPQIEENATIVFKANDIIVGTYNVPIGTEISDAFEYTPVIGTFNGWKVNEAGVSYPYTINESVVWVADITLPELESEEPVVPQ